MRELLLAAAHYLEPHPMPVYADEFAATRPPVHRVTVQPSVEGQPQACAIVETARGVRYIWWTWDGRKVVRHE